MEYNFFLYMFFSRFLRVYKIYMYFQNDKTSLKIESYFDDIGCGQTSINLIFSFFKSHTKLRCMLNM